MPITKAPPGYLTVAEAAALAGRNPATVRLAAQAGELRGTQPKPKSPWCFKPADVLAWRGIEETAEAS